MMAATLARTPTHLTRADKPTSTEHGIRTFLVSRSVLSVGTDRDPLTSYLWRGVYRRGSSEGGVVTDEVKFTNEQWDALAEAAEVFAATLDDERARLRDVLVSNWAGACAEGESTMDNLKALVHGDSGSFSQAIFSEASYLKDVALGCRGAKTILKTVDHDNSSGFNR